MVSRWAVVVRGRLADGDLGSDGAAPTAVVSDLVREGAEAYLGLVSSIHRLGLAPELDVGPTPPLQVGPARTVLVAATTTEVLPESFVISVRLRPLGGGDGRPVDYRCLVRLGVAGELPAELRDELIEIEKGASRTA